MPTRSFFIGDPPPPFFRGTGTVFPNQDLWSMDDEQIKEILLRLGIHNLFVAPTEPGPMFAASTSDLHPTHRLLFARYTGNPRERDNGYVMFGWLKSRHTFEQVEGYIRDFVHENAVVGALKITRGTPVQ